MQSFLSLVSYRGGIFNGTVIISMQLAETLTEGETDLLITDTDNEWWESKLSILITFPDWNTGCVIFSVAMETWHHTSAELMHSEGHIRKKKIVLFCLWTNCIIFEWLAEVFMHANEWLSSVYYSEVLIFRVVWKGKGRWWVLLNCCLLWLFILAYIQDLLYFRVFCQFLSVQKGQDIKLFGQNRSDLKLYLSREHQLTISA